MKICFLDDLVKKGFDKIDLCNKIARQEEEFFPQYPYNTGEIKNACEQSSGNALLLVDEKKVVGYLIPLLFENKNYLQILTIAIDKNHQRKGYGTKLIEECEQIAKSLRLKRVISRVDPSYPPLKTFKNLGYAPMRLEEIEEFISEGIFSSEDEIRKGEQNLELFPEGYHIMTKDIGKKNFFSFVPMVKNL